EKEISRVQQTENETEQTTISRQRFDFLEDNQLLSTYANFFDIAYDGKENDQATVILEQTEKGLKMDIKGAVRASLRKEETERTEKQTKINYTQIDSIIDQNIDRNFSELTQLIHEETSRAKEIQVKGLQFGMFALLAILITIVVFSFAIYIYIKKLT
ncbi:hypothetical protein QP519_11590, partial [Weeksella virosa]|uniref:hypothetical protein n=1 Tax=Weeksella virosa TaxID=1014 RepID=UPI0025543FFE